MRRRDQVCRLDPVLLAVSPEAGQLTHPSLDLRV